MLTVCLGSDHRGYHLKARLMRALSSHGFKVIDEGTHSEGAVDYPDFAEQVARKVSCGQADRGILICGTGIGMSITANKFDGVRAAPCYDEVMVEISRRHNDVNVLCLPGDLIGERCVDDLVLMWLRTDFEGGRHETRVKKIGAIESSVRGGDADNGSAPPAGTEPARSNTGAPPAGSPQPGSTTAPDSPQATVRE